MVNKMKQKQLNEENQTKSKKLNETEETEEEAEEEEEELERELETETEEQELIQQTTNYKSPKTKKKTFTTKVYLISSTICFSIFLTFFILAPTIKITKKSTSILNNNNNDINSKSNQKKPIKFIKPIGPPGSITDKTNNWANQGGNWKDNNNNHTDVDSDSLPLLNSLLSNGTHLFNKTLIIVSLDGFRAEYLERGLTPRLTTIKEKHGISAEYLEPQFPTLTFPNHWSMLTGLYPETHGIVANDFRDPNLKKSFSNVDPHKSWDPIWWSGEPIWATATKHGLKTAVSMWPGPPYTSDKTRPTYWRAYEDRHKWWKKMKQLETWLDLSLEERPEFIAMYIPEVDQMGHQYGPNDKKFSQSLKNVDLFVGALYDSLQSRNLSDIVDVIYVGDHGMMATSDQKIVYLDQILGKTFFDQIQFQDGWPAAGLRFPDEIDTKPILEKLINESKINDGFVVYTHQTMPKRWHFTENDRIAPIYVFPKPGWVISSTHEHQVVMNSTYNVKGIHGYDNKEEFMRSIFIGHGPFTGRIKAKQLSSIRDRRRRRTIPSEEMKKEEKKPTSSSSSIGTGGGGNHQSNNNIVVGRLPPFSNLEIYSLLSILLRLDPFIDLNTKNCSIGFWNQFF